MSIDIYDSEQQLAFLENIVEDNLIFNFKITFPNKIKFVLANKNSKFDTKIDSSGNIIADKYVRLTKMSVGNIPVESLNLLKLCDYRYNNQQATSLYWSFNGTVNIDFNAEDFLMWHLTNNNKFEI